MVQVDIFAELGYADIRKAISLLLHGLRRVKMSKEKFYQILKVLFVGLYSVVAALSLCCSAQCFMAMTNRSSGSSADGCTPLAKERRGCSSTGTGCAATSWFMLKSNHSNTQMPRQSACRGCCFVWAEYLLFVSRPTVPLTDPTESASAVRRLSVRCSSPIFRDRTCNRRSGYAADSPQSSGTR